MVEDNPHNPSGAAQIAILRERELAVRWKVSTRTLQRWRSEGFGPGYILIGGSIRYRFADVLAFEERHLEEGADQ